MLLIDHAGYYAVGAVEVSTPLQCHSCRFGIETSNSVLFCSIIRVVVEVKLKLAGMSILNRLDITANVIRGILVLGSDLRYR